MFLLGFRPLWKQILEFLGIFKIILKIWPGCKDQVKAFKNRGRALTKTPGPYLGRGTRSILTGYNNHIFIVYSMIITHFVLSSIEGFPLILYVLNETHVRIPITNKNNGIFLPTL